MGILVQAGNDAAETKTTKNVSRGRYHICTDINRSLDNWSNIFVYKFKMYINITLNTQKEEYFLL